MVELKGRLARVESEHRELKQLILDLRADISSLITQQPTVRSSVSMTNYVVNP